LQTYEENYQKNSLKICKKPTRKQLLTKKITIESPNLVKKLEVDAELD
ncbi:8435_t:CDS:1, partial [Cetraspora pellucida]